jgi:hypothetical protein
MVNRGEFVVKTWFLGACFSTAKIFLFFEIYFFVSIEAKKQKQIPTG